LGEIHVQWAEPVILPVGELNRLRRELVFALQSQLETTRQEDPAALATALARIRSSQNHVASSLAPRLSVLVRSEAQLAAVLARPTSAAIFDVYCDFEDIRRYKGAVERVRDSRSGLQILLATPRIQKAGEAGFFKVIESACPDGVLIRNLGAINAFSGSPLRRVADFSLNVANPLTASHFMRFGFERLTVSYDLNIEQALSLVRNCAPDWFEITLHQHMPMFHMEHCVFAAFLSKGKDHTDCGRPCEKHRVHLRDRVGIEHPLRADVGCRNTLFNATAQTGAKYFAELQAVGITHFRVEFLEEEGREVDSILATYEALLSGQSSGENLWRKLHAHSQLGVTDGTLAPGAAAR
jgi:putative protease